MQQGLVCLYGAGVLNSTTMQTTYNSVNAVLRSLAGSDGVVMQWTNFVAHPSQTPGAPGSATQSSVCQSLEIGKPCLEGPRNLSSCG